MTSTSKILSPYGFIVRPEGGKRYDNTTNVGGVELILSSSKEDHTVSNRVAVVVECPQGYKGPIEPGDKLLVHHNVFKVYNDMSGRERSGKAFLKDNLFIVDNRFGDTFFAYNKNGKWFAVDGYCFVRPVRSKKYFIHKGHYEDLVGQMVLVDSSISSLGIKPGDEVGFTENSEYLFRVDGEPLYRVLSRDICLKL